MQAFILAGGFGAKLRETIYNQPKILAPVKGQAFIDHLFYLLKKRNFSQAVLGLGYLSDQVKSYVNHCSLDDLKVYFSVDPRPLGTAGSVANASKYLTESDFFIINGDTYLDFDYSKALKFHQDKNALLTIVTARNRFSGDFSSVSINKENQVVDFSQKSIDSQGETVHAGIYIANPSILSMIPSGSKYSIEKHLIPQLIEKKKIFAYDCNKTFYDIGDNEGYQLANQELER